MNAGRIKRSDRISFIHSPPSSVSRVFEGGRSQKILLLVGGAAPARESNPHGLGVFVCFSISMVLAFLVIYIDLLLCRIVSNFLGEKNRGIPHLIESRCFEYVCTVGKLQWMDGWMDRHPKNNLLLLLAPIVRHPFVS